MPERLKLLQEVNPARGYLSWGPILRLQEVL
jgi:hypothetical protein